MNGVFYMYNFQWKGHCISAQSWTNFFHHSEYPVACSRKKHRIAFGDTKRKKSRLGSPTGRAWRALAPVLPLCHHWTNHVPATEIRGPVFGQLYYWKEPQLPGASHVALRMSMSPLSCLAVSFAWALLSWGGLPRACLMIIFFDAKVIGRMETGKEWPSSQKTLG